MVVHVRFSDDWRSEKFKVLFSWEAAGDGPGILRQLLHLLYLPSLGRHRQHRHQVAVIAEVSVIMCEQSFQLDTISVYPFAMMKIAKIQTPMKSLMLWLRSFDIFFWLLVNIVPITNTTTENSCQQRKV